MAHLPAGLLRHCTAAGLALALVALLASCAHDPPPTIDAFDVSPASLPSSGGAVTLDWTARNAAAVSLTSSPALTGLPTVPGGSVTLPANTSGAPIAYTFTLKATALSGSAEVSRTAKATVGSAFTLSVRDAADTPAAGATVELYRGGAFEQLLGTYTTDGTGDVRVALDDGSYSYRVSNDAPPAHETEWWGSKGNVSLSAASTTDLFRKRTPYIAAVSAVGDVGAGTVTVALQAGNLGGAQSVRANVVASPSGAFADAANVTGASACTTVVNSPSGGNTALQVTLSPPSPDVTFALYVNLQACGAGSPYVDQTVPWDRSVAYTTLDTFDIDVEFQTAVTAAQRAAFEGAAVRWAQVITAGFPAATIALSPGDCGGSLPSGSVSGVVDDLRIDVWAVSIDGPGGILGQAGPCRIRTADALPVYGVMQLDVADLADMESGGELQSVVLHEMGHVLGIGTLWNYGRALLTGGGTSNPRFVGAHAVAPWHTLGGGGDVPVENCLDAANAPIAGCGAGTRDGHWREAVFGTELMTGYLGGGSNPLSRVTIGSLEDMGYTVDYGAADSFALPTGVTAQSARGARELREVLLTPKRP